MDDQTLKPSFADRIWPDASTPVGITASINWGVGVLIYIALGYGFLALIVGTARQEPATDELVIYLASFFAAAFFAWQLWLTRLPVYAWLGLAWVTVELIVKLFSFRVTGILILLVALFGAINGVAGARANRKSKTQAAVNPSADA